jgi:HK97 family phage major capsid protein
VANMKQLQDKLQTVLKAARDICAVAETEERDLTADERTMVAKQIEEAKGLKEQIKQAKSDADLIASIAAMGEGIELAGGGVPPTAVQAAAKGTIGERFIQSKGWQEWISRFPNRVIPEGAKGLMSPPVEFKGLLKTLITGDSATSAGAFVEPDYTGIYEPLGRRPRSLLDLIPRASTTSDTVWFVRQTTRVQQATPVAEANVTDYTGATGEVSGEKPEGAMAFEQVSMPVKTVAVWIPATKRALSDAAQLRSIIDLELREDIQEELEEQIYDGDGAGENFTGITNTANVLTQAWDTDIFRTTRLAKLAVETTGLSEPTAFVMHPNDWAEIELSRDGENRYYYGGPMSIGDKRLWGLPVVTSMALDEGVALVGNWRKARLWDRESATISMSDSHSDFFIRNMIAVLCELRAAFALIRPTAFCQIDVSSGS